MHNGGGGAGSGLYPQPAGFSTVLATCREHPRVRSNSDSSERLALQPGGTAGLPGARPDAHRPSNPQPASAYGSMFGESRQSRGGAGASAGTSTPMAEQGESSGSPPERKVNPSSRWTQLSCGEQCFYAIEGTGEYSLDMPAEGYKDQFEAEASWFAATLDKVLSGHSAAGGVGEAGQGGGLGGRDANPMSRGFPASRHGDRGDGGSQRRAGIEAGRRGSRHAAGGGREAGGAPLPREQRRAERSENRLYREESGKSHRQAWNDDAGRGPAQLMTGALDAAIGGIGSLFVQGGSQASGKAKNSRM